MIHTVRVCYMYQDNARTLYCDELYIVKAETQYDAMKKTEKFVAKLKSNPVFTFVEAHRPETGQYGYMIRGIIQ